MARHYSSKEKGRRLREDRYDDGMRFSTKEQSYKHERDEFNDEIRHDKGMPSVAQRYPGKRQEEGYYSGMEDRLNQEAVDGSMIREDHNAVANLPQMVIMRPYRKGGYGIPEGLNDTIEGVDRQIAYDDSLREKHMYPKKV